MRAVRVWFARLGEPFFKRRRDAEFAAEMESHVQMHMEDGVRSGLAPEEARRQALIAFGGVEQVKKVTATAVVSRARSRHSGCCASVSARYAKIRRFTAVAVLTLALGIGATTAIFALVHAVLLNSLPVTRPGELYRVGNVEQCCNTGSLQDNWSLFSYEQYKSSAITRPALPNSPLFRPELRWLASPGQEQSTRSIHED